MKTKYLIISFVITLFFLSGCSKTTSQPRTPPAKPTLAQVLSTTPDSAMQSRWKAAEGTLPPLDKIPQPAQVISKRIPGTVVADMPSTQRPVIPRESIGEVQPFSPESVRRYSGPIKIVEAVEGRIAGMIGEKKQSIELLFKLPGEKQIVAMDTSGESLLDLRDDVENNTIQRHTLLSTKSGAIALFYISEGGMAPFAAEYKNAQLAVRQIPGKDEGDGTVEVTYGRTRVRAKVGQKVALGDKTLFVIALTAHRTKTGPLMEGDPFHVTLMVY